MPSRDDPFGEIEQILTELTDLGTGTTPVDVLDTGEAFVVTVDLPGYDPADVDVRLREGRHLEVDAEREQSDETEGEQFVRRERTQESVHRSVAIPEPVDEADTEASYDNGVLTVRLPKRGAEDGGTDIPVN